MKNLIIITIFISALYSCKAQNPIVAIDASPTSTIDGAYFKDLNNEFNKFEGTWEYSEGNISFIIKLKKKELYFDGKDYHDIILGEYKYSENGSDLVNTLSNFNNSNGAGHKIIGNLIIPINLFVACSDCLPNERRVKLTFYDPERLYLSASIILRYLSDGDPFGTGAQMTATIISDGGGIIPDENSPTELRVPYGEYLMVKQ